MREIISVHVGQCGNSIGYKFWEVIVAEHGINVEGLHCGEDPCQLKGINVYFREVDSETRNSRYVPRTILADLESGVFDSIREKEFGKLFEPDSFVAGSSGAGKNWAKGYFSEGLELSSRILERIRKEAEDCDCLQGFQIVHSIGGGTGSGLGCLMIERIRDMYPDPIISTHTVIPSPKVSDVIVEPYNAVLSTNTLVEFTDTCFTIDNEALYNIGMFALKKKQPVYGELNHVVANTMSGITAAFRFPGQLNGDLRKLAVNLVPFPRLHFLIPSFAPLTSSASVSDLIVQIFDPKNMMADIDPRKGKFFAVGAIFRGKVSAKQVEQQIVQLRHKNESYFTDWIPDGIKTTVCDISPLGFHKTATGIMNTSAIQEIFKRIVNQFSKMFERKAFLHWFQGEGVDEEDFTISEFNMNNLCDEYHIYEEAEIESGDDEDTGSSVS
ncbi:tubulin beta chain-like isoform X1 [Planococcus citri]|uniref:tubulin beta chain-like isoform X1 n=1 Tax=Planococcus citri TaxID=170843 RepID=UPI0031F933C6